jgi:pyrimidine-nucleoside phosphorylase
LASSLNTIAGIKLTFATEEMQFVLDASGGVFAYPTSSLQIIHDRLASRAKSEWQLFTSISLLTMNSLESKHAVYDIKINDSLTGFDLNIARESVYALKEQLDRLGINVSYFLSPMHQPLGQALGPTLELIEAFETLKGRGPLDVKKIVLEQGADLILLSEHAANRTEAKSTLKSLLLNGDAQNKIEEIIGTQGGDPGVVNDYARLPMVAREIEIYSPKTGYVTRMKIARLKTLKRRLMDIHPGAGLIFQKSVGDQVNKDEPLVRLHFPEPRCPVKLQDEIQNIFVIADHKPKFYPFIEEKIKGNF